MEEMKIRKAMDKGKAEERKQNKIENRHERNKKKTEKEIGG